MCTVRIVSFFCLQWGGAPRGGTHRNGPRTTRDARRIHASCHKWSQVQGLSERDEGIQRRLTHSARASLRSTMTLTQRSRGKHNMRTSRRVQSPRVLTDRKDFFRKIVYKKESGEKCSEVLIPCPVPSTEQYMFAKLLIGTSQISGVWLDSGHSGWKFALNHVSNGHTPKVLEQRE